MKTALMLLALLASITTSCVTNKPTIYNNVTSEGAEIDHIAKVALAPKFTIVDIRDSTNYVRAKATAGRLPRVARTAAGEPLGGAVLVAYVVSTDGRATSPVVLKTADERLNATAIKATEEWRFMPGTLNGVSVATTAAQEFHFETAPTEFVQQVLEPTGGKISRPKDWFYAEGHGGHRYMWTLSREDSNGPKPYATGVRVQMFTGIKEGAGKTARQFILDFVEAKKKEAAKVIKSCDPEAKGLFTRMCLETEEGPHHILYSLFWSKDDLDIAVVIIAGTTQELWDVYATTFEKMGRLELIDMQRAEK